MMMRVNMNDVNSQRKNFKGGKENNKIWESVPVMIVFFSDCSSIDMMENNIFWNKIEKKFSKFYFVILLILNTVIMIYNGLMYNGQGSNFVGNKGQHWRVRAEIRKLTDGHFSIKSRFGSPKKDCQKIYK